MSGITLTEVDDATIATPATGKATLFLDDTIGPAYKDDLGVTNSLTGADGASAPALTYQDHGNTGATETIDASAADVHRLVLDSATVTITLSGAPASGTVKVIQAYIVQDGTGGRDLAWPGAVVWGSVGEPEWTTRTAGQIDLVTLETVDGGTTWAASLAGAPGLVGGGVAIPYTFSTTTTDADPGAGNLRFDNATTASVTKIRADLLGSDGSTVTAILDSLDDSTNTIKGHVRIVRTNAPSRWWLGTVSSVDSSSGYRNITVVYVAQSGASPFANGDAITLTFTRAGDAGSSGTANVATDPIFDAAGDLPVGTGADTAAKLSKGTAAYGLVSNSSTLVWAEILPWHIQLIPMVATPDATTGTWALNSYSDNGLNYGFYVPGSTANSGSSQVWTNASAVAVNDACAWDIVLAQGTWDCHIWTRKGTNVGIYTLNQDGVSMGTVDGYAAATAAAKLSITGWSVSATGKKRMQFLMATKNASSSNYVANLFAIEFRRTA